MKIRPQRGVDGLMLGIHRDLIPVVLGPPDHARAMRHSDDSIEELWDYEALGVELCFSSVEDFRLSCILVRSPEAELLGHRLVGLPSARFLAVLAEAGIEVQLEDDGTATGVYLCEALDLMFVVVDGRVDHICVMPAFDDETDLPRWPTSTTAVSQEG